MKTTETFDQATRRLATKARLDGVRIVRDPVDARYYATSTSQPRSLYYVTLLSCTCKGFIAHQRCKHHAAILAAYGQLPPDPGAPTCANCGSHDAPHADTRSRWVGGGRDGYVDATTVHRCDACHRREGGALDRIAA